MGDRGPIEGARRADVFHVVIVIAFALIARLQPHGACMCGPEAPPAMAHGLTTCRQPKLQSLIPLGLLKSSRQHFNASVSECSWLQPGHVHQVHGRRLREVVVSRRHLPWAHARTASCSAQSSSSSITSISSEATLVISPCASLDRPRSRTFQRRHGGCPRGGQPAGEHQPSRSFIL